MDVLIVRIKIEIFIINNNESNRNNECRNINICI